MEEEGKFENIFKTYRKYLQTEGKLSYSKRIEDPEKYKNTNLKT